MGNLIVGGLLYRRILFLDVDGVLNGDDWLQSLSWEDYAQDVKHFDPECVRLYNQIIRRTSARVVLSTGWRLKYSQEALVSILRRAGVEGDIVGRTPVRVTREEEVGAWVSSARDLLVAGFTMVVLEDFHVMGRFEDRTVRTQGLVGLRPADVERAVQLLEGSYERSDA